MMKPLILILMPIFWWINSFSLHAQAVRSKIATEEAYQKVIRETNVSELNALAQKAAEELRISKLRALDSAKKYGWEIRRLLPDSSVMELVGMDDKNMPVYYITESNLDAGRTIRTHHVWNGGSMGLNLDGDGMLAGEWDAGRCRPTHNEFQTASGTRIINGDGAGNESHATHVGGTIIAAGNDAQARGMANLARLKSFDWNSDVSEMATEGASGLLVSNHSYGQLAGWQGCNWYGNLNISTTLDYTFGLYTGATANWDQIAVNAPYYLICKAAGNDRGQNCGGAWRAFINGSWVENPDGYTRPPADGPYDCISTYGNAKNIMTVAAVNDQINYTTPASVTMSGFSSWGPTDDGRIKPDISANGVTLYSTEVNNDNAYSIKSGTSMATPTVTGSALLIQEHHKNLTGSFMRSATLKGLIIHTADETGGNPGPDYAFGWGLMNTGRAVQHITDNNVTTVIREENLNNGQTYTFQVYSDGTQPLRTTICWTDPAGTPNLPVLNERTPRLVNDLDLRVSNGTTFMPWVLDPNNPANAATVGDNIRDNVEQVLISTPTAGVYTITINHKGTLQGGSQRFSLIISTVNCFAAINTLPTTTYCAGQTVNLQANTGTGLTYQWTLNGADILGATNNNYNATLSGIYRVRVTRGGCTQTSLPVTLTFNPQTIAGTLNGTATVCAGANVPLSLTGNTGTVVRWESSTDNFATVNTINQTVTNLTVNAISTTTRFRAVVQSAPCAEANSNSVLITVTGFGGTTSAPATVCADNNTGTITLTGNSGAVLSWESSTDNFATVTNIPFTGNILTFTNVSMTTQFRARIDNPSCPPAPSSATTITTIPQPDVTVSASPASPTCDLAPVNLSSIYTPAPPFDDCNRYTLQTIAAAPFPHTGTNVFGSAVDDAVSAFIPIGFNFNFFCNDFTQLKVSSNGFLSFQNTVDHGCCSGGVIPATDGINNLIAPIWTDNILNNADNIKYQTIGTAPERKFIISFGNNYRYYGEGNNISCQVVLHESDNIIDLIAVNIPASAKTRTMGIENADGTIGYTPAGRNATSGWSEVNKTYRFIPFNSPANFSYAWSNAGNGFSATTPNATDNSPVMGNSTYRLTVAHAGTGCSKTYDLPYQIDPPTVAGTISANATVCTTANSGTIALTGNTGNVVRWESSTDNFVTATTIPNIALTQSYTNLAQTTAYRAVVKSGACSAQNTNTVTITVDPATISGTLTASQTVCVTANSGTMTLTGFTGNIVRWESSTDNFTTVTNIPNTTPTQNFTNLLQTTQFRAVVKSGVCLENNSNTVQITVDPATVAGTLSASQTVCASANAGTMTLAGFTGNIVRWESSTDNFATVTNIPNTTPTQNFTNLIQTTQFRAVVKSGVCAMLTSNAVQITVDAPTVAGTLAADQTVCASVNSGTVTLAGHTGNIVRWESSTNNWATVNTIAFTGNALAYLNLNQTTAFRVIVRNGTCFTLSSNNVIITVNPLTVAGTLGNDATVCAGSNNGFINLFGNTGNVVRWESSIDNWTTVNTINNTNITYNYTNLAQTTAYRAVVQSGVCAPQTTNVVTVTTDVPTVAGTLSANATYCIPNATGSLTLAGYQGNIVRWESSTDNFATVQTIVNNTPTLPYNNLLQTTAYRVVVQSGVCPVQTSNTVTLTVYPATVAGILSGNATVCFGSNSGSITLTGHTGTILRWESSTDNWATVTTIVNQISVYNYLNLTQSIAYRAVVESGNCGALTTNTVNITVDPQTVSGILSEPQTVCAGGNSGIINLNTFTGNIIRWESSTDNFATVTNIPNTTPTQSFTNLVQSTAYRVLVQSGVCPAQYSNVVTIQVDAPTVAGVLSSNMTVCQSGNTGTLNLTGHQGNIIRWESSTDNFATVTVINHPIANYTFNNLTQTTAYRVYVKSGVCEDLYSNAVTVQVDLPTVAGTLSQDMTLCQSNANGTMTLTGNRGNIIRWESSTDNWATVTTINNNSNAYSFSNLPISTRFRAVVQNGVCPVVNSNEVLIQVDPATVGGTLNGFANVCTGNNAGTLNLTGYQGNILRWESSDAIFARNIVTINNTTPNQDYLNLTRTTWYRVVIKSGICAEQTSSWVNVNVTNPPTGGTLNGSRTVCGFTNSGSLRLTGNTGTLIYWEFSPDNWATITTLNGTGNTLTYANLTRTTSYRAVMSNGNICPNAYSSVATITVTTPTVAGTLSANQTVCNESNSGTLTLTGNVGLIQTWQSSINNGVSWQNFAAGNSFNYQNLTLTTRYRVIVRNSPCGNATSNAVTVTVRPATVAGTLTGNATYCTNTNAGFIRLTGNQGILLRWERSTDNFATVSTLPPAGPNLIYNNVSQTTQYRAVVQNGICSPKTSNAVTITILPTLNGGVLSQNQTICDNQTAILALNGHQGQILSWEKSDDNWTTVFPITNTTATYTVTNLTASTSYRVKVGGNGCPAVYSNPVKITVQRSAVAGTLTGGQTICAGENNGLLTLTGYSGTIVRWESSTDNWATVTTINNNAPTYLYLNLTQTTLFRAVIAGDPLCGTVNSSPVTVTVTPPTVAGMIDAPDYVCAGNSVTLNLIGFTGQIVKWEFKFDYFEDFHSIVEHSAPSLTILDLKTTALFRVIVQNGVCPPETTEVKTVKIINKLDGGNVTAVTGSNSSCANPTGYLRLNNYTGNILHWEYSTNNWTTIQTIAHTLDTISYSRLPVTGQYRAVVGGDGCASVASTAVQYVSGLRVSLSAETGCGNLGYATAVPTGGLAPYRYFLFPNSGAMIAEGVFAGLQAGVYRLTVLDARNCFVQVMFTIEGVTPAPLITAAGSNAPTNGRIVWTETRPGNPSVVYEVRFRPVSNPNFTTVTVINGTTLIVDTLQSGTTYETQVRASCLQFGTFTAWSVAQTFTTLSVKEATLTARTTGTFSVYPNPTQESFTLQYHTQQPFKVILTDLTGKKVAEKALKLSGTYTFDVTELPAGVYVVRAWNEDRILFTEKLVIIR